MMKFCPWKKSAFQDQPKLKYYIWSWVGPNRIFLELRDWFIQGHNIVGYEQDGLFQVPIIKQGFYVCTPPTAAAIVVIEELIKAQIKIQNSTHLIIIPKLLASTWMKQLYKVADCITYCPWIQPLPFSLVSSAVPVILLFLTTVSFAYIRSTRTRRRCSSPIAPFNCELPGNACVSHQVRPPPWLPNDC